MTSVPHSGAKSVTPGGSVAGHTPGPWEVKAGYFNGGPCIRTVADDRWIAGDFSRTAVAGGEAEVEANAYLMAAAPELLEALREARDALHQHYVDWDGEPEDAVPLQLARAKCEAAIAKATAGETRNAEGAL